MIATVTLNPSLDEWMHVPALRTGRLHRATGFARYPGGKGINVSRVVHELGGRTLALALAGGADGEILHALLRRMRIPHAFVSVAGTTRNNYKIHTAQPPTLTEINTAGPRVSVGNLRALQHRLLRHAQRVRCAVLSGSLPPGAPAATYQRWIRALRRHHIPCALDASGDALRRGLAARPWLIKPNREEAQGVLRMRIGSLRGAAAAARQLLEHGPEIVVLSLGKEGAVMAARSLDGVWWAQPPVVRTDSAVGAGDSLVGGFVAGWGQQRSLVDALRWGVACGAATAMTPGTELCHRPDVTRLLPRVRLRRIG